MSENNSLKQTSGQSAEELASVEGTGFSPYISSMESTRALAPEERFPENPPTIPSFPGIPEEFPANLPQPILDGPEPSLLFQSFTQPEIIPPARIPNLGHLLILALLMTIGTAGSMLLTWSALHFHLFAVSTVKQAETDIHYTLGSQAILYLLTFAPCLLIFPLFWRKGFFAGLQWNGATALRQRWRLMGAACVCILLAIVDEGLLPGPDNAPIDKLFQTPLAAWLLFAFGVTFAPFFEEIVFRGFLLPALCTAWDWLTERANGEPVRPLDANGHPQWSIPAMAVASLLTSIPFALMHAEQTGYSLGPFLLLVCVSLVLCWARLSTRSLAASVLVHASYNFMLFFLMLLGTGGFRHLDKM
jgi:membrane protease YdiL (CAAX protease family)